MQENNTRSTLDGNAPYGAAHGTEPVIDVRGLTKRYGSVVAVDGLSFSLPRGTITGQSAPSARSERRSRWS